MMKLASFAALSAPLLAYAAQWDVTVGGDAGLVYTPPYVNAAVGDVVNFIFKPKNHTATQSTFDAPCTYNGGFDSGFKPVTATDAELTTAQFPVTNMEPAWFYCRQQGPPVHCTSGMVFAVNPPASGNTFQAFQDKAKALAATATGTATVTSAATASVMTHTELPTIVTVTKTVTVGDNVWTTTYGSWPGSSEPTPASQSVNHVVIVGGSAGNVYTPNKITAAVGDTVTFQFRAKNHTVTQSSFTDPCRKLEFTSDKIGFDTGFMPVDASITDESQFPTWVLPINDTAPVFGYCRQTGHCGQGMVFSINAVDSTEWNFDNFKSNAIAINGTTASSSSAAPSASGGSSGSPNAGNKLAVPGVLAFAGLLAALAL